MTAIQRRTGVMAACLVVTAVAITACRTEPPEEIESEAAVAVTTATATLGDIRGVVHATGLVSAAPGAELVVVAPEPARIAELRFAAGDRVRRGDLLVRFEIPVSAADVQKQQAEVIRADATLNSAVAAQTRARALFDRGVAARREVEDADRGVADAQAALAQARASLAAAETVAARSTVRATFDGVVAERHHNPGDLVDAAASDAVLRVIDPRRLEVVASVPLADVMRVDLNAAAHVVGAPIGATDIDLKVISRPAAVEAGTASVPIRLALTAAGTIPVGTPVQIDIDADQHHDVVLVPDAAIVREGDETAVFVARDGKAQRRAVTLGLDDGVHAEIASGVKAGENVIVDGQAGLPDDAAISVRDAATPAAPGTKQDDRP